MSDMKKDRGPRRGNGEGRMGGRGMRRAKRKICQFCVDKVTEIDYKDLMKTRKYLSEREDSSQKDFRLLCKAPASADKSHQEGQTHCFAALHN